MKRLLILFCSFPLAGMNGAKSERAKVSEEHQELFWSICNALKAGETDKAKSLVSQTPAILRCCDSEKRTVLHISIEKKRTNFALWLISLPQCPLNAVDKLERSPLAVATLVGETEVAIELVKRGARFDAHKLKAAIKDSSNTNKPFLAAFRNQNNTVLHNAIDENKGNLAALIAANQNLINQQNLEGDTPLHRAIIRSDEKSVELLLDAGALMFCNCAGRTPLHMAAAEASTSLSVLLLKKVENPRVSDIQRSLLHTPRAQEQHAAETLLLLSDKRNYLLYEEGLITITNDTSWRLKLTFMLHGKMGEIIILPGDQFLFYANLGDLTQLKIELYGKLWSYAQKKPLDLYVPWCDALAGEPTYTYEIKIKGDKSTIWQFIAPFVITSHGNGAEFYQPTTRISLDQRISGAFPCVIASLKKPKPVTARNFLQISSSATPEAVQLAYTLLDTLWKRQRTVAQRAYVDRVRALLAIAYEELATKKVEIAAAFVPQELVLSSNAFTTAEFLQKRSLEAFMLLYKEMGAITPEILTLFQKGFGKEELLQLLRLKDGSGKTAAFIALEKGNNDLYKLLLTKEVADRL